MFLVLTGLSWWFFLGPSWLQWHGSWGRGLQCQTDHMSKTAFFYLTSELSCQLTLSHSGWPGFSCCGCWLPRGPSQDQDLPEAGGRSFQASSRCSYVYHVLVVKPAQDSCRRKEVKKWTLPLREIRKKHVDRECCSFVLGKCSLLAMYWWIMAGTCQRTAGRILCVDLESSSYWLWLLLPPLCSLLEWDWGVMHTVPQYIVL